MLLIVQELKLVVFLIIAHIIAFGSNMFLILMLCIKSLSFVYDGEHR
jgi:hypothetical protein